MKQHIGVLVLVFLCPFVICRAQAPTAIVNGQVRDSSGAAIPNASVEVINDATNVHYATETNDEGIYSVPNLAPGTYHIRVSKQGFKTIVHPDITLNVQDAKAIGFTLPVGPVSDTVTVEGGASLINTESATVSTVVDRRFVENMPLNGRSVQTLLTLTPGAVATHASGPNQGQFSVNGQRDDANYFTIDGVSANVGSNAALGLTQTVGGVTPAWSAQGGTNSLVSVDAMQEFRIQTSTFAPEFGRTPGAQISIVTRSGTNQFHGTVFDYLRNDVLDAKDWFANRNGLLKPKERQNDFGGVVGGPIIRDKTFFFFSYEGLRLRLPKSQTTVVPDSNSRNAAATSVQPLLKAFPLPNGQNFGNGTAQFAASYSDPSTLDAYSLRLDHAITSRVTLFGRYSYSPSEITTRGLGGAVPLSGTQTASFSAHTLTLGLTQTITQMLSNELRTNYSNARAGTTNSLDAFGGATPPPDSSMFPAGFTGQNSNFGFIVFNPFLFFTTGKNSINEQRQVNLIDNVSLSVGTHQLKFGVDYRWLAPFSSPRFYTDSANFSALTGATSTASGVVASFVVNARRGVALLSRNFSFYGQDTWNATRRLTLTYGLRWDINPALQGKSSTDQPFTVQGLENPATMALATPGTSLYETTYGNVAPRVGLAYRLDQRAGRESVIRGGFGIFYDLGTGSLGSLSLGFPFLAAKSLTGIPYPPTPAQFAPPAFSNRTPLPAGTDFTVADRHLKLPRTYEWNLAVEQSLGTNDTLSVTYVGAIGRDQLRVDTLSAPNPNFLGTVRVTRNTSTSDYHALQLQYQRRLSSGLQAKAAYTWSHSIDIASTDSFFTTTPTLIANPSIDRGNSDFDVRHSLTTALSYDIPSPGTHRVARRVLGDWSVDTFLFARSNLPVNISAATVVVSGTNFTARPNVVSGVPLYLFGPQFPGGKAFNKAAFSSPSSGQQGNFGRNVLRGFGAWQQDFALRRQFHLTERAALQFRAEFFNIFNHPNFGDPNNTTIASSLFGQSTQTLASSLGVPGAGFSPLYQIGGPRSVQFALKAIF